MRLAFLACVERGRLESQSLLLCRSIRRNVGRFRDAPIHTFQPRAGTTIEDATLTELRAMGVQHHTDTLNRDFVDYPISNKVFACAHAEQTLDEDVLVFIDTDTVFVNQPDEFDLPAGVHAAVRPVDHKNCGSTGPGARDDPYWRRLYELCGVSRSPFIETAVSAQRIRAYYNSGLVCVRRSVGIFQRWLEHFLLVARVNHLPNGNIHYLDQLTLATALAQFDNGEVRVLKPNYNYPIPKRPLLPPVFQYPLDNLVHIHYHRWFNRPNFLREIRPAFNPESEMFRWLDGHLPLQPTIDEALRF